MDDDDWDYYEQEDNREYMAASCEDPHKDGSVCMPSWDGFVYICINRMIREYKERIAAEKIPR